ncbi:MAG: phenylpropionate dioxygenase-like ring-hydroxylating dioxygenase large terminal subunit [Halioglobus sp.]|jgi:phenylpropionate dioxygenase-like ring-hydroxylating dioxygenase large terminal subunit
MVMPEIPADRYNSNDFQKLEWERLWRRVWNMGPKLNELRSPGDYITHTLGKEQLVFVLNEQGQLRGFYNVCRHRGNVLCRRYRGSMKTFYCAFHGWKYDLDGAVTDIPHRERFFGLDDPAQQEKLNLTPLLVDVWGGWIWFNLDPDAAPLMEFLGEIPEKLAGYQFEKATLIDYKTFEFDCNWKTTLDAFNESYHFPALHRQILPWGNEDAPITLLGLHSMMINQYGVASPSLDDRETISEQLEEYLRGQGIAPETFDGQGLDIRAAVQEHKRKLQNDTHFPYKSLEDGQLTDAYHYLVFPNVHFNCFAEFHVAMRYRPHPSGNPGRMLFDFLMFAPLAPGETVKPFTHKVAKGGVDAVSDVLEWGARSFPASDEVLEQDIALLPFVQLGMNSDSFDAMHLGADESRLSHFHENLMRYIKE